ncbi:hypothetical protein OsI_23523 [Oryza sativa Indica Group]|uniref:Uncharacterized protein n=1 Tax=Oryza sativa subsp. indica TaxID=39946 RepID=B8B449_ORYSI|nr:hypothetical protein OsI_23523 [Oryza sativa Indica Group]
MGKTTAAVECAAAAEGADLGSSRGGWRRSRIRRRLEKKSAWAAERDNLGSGQSSGGVRLRPTVPVHVERSEEEDRIARGEA